MADEMLDILLEGRLFYLPILFVGRIGVGLWITTVRVRNWELRRTIGMGIGKTVGSTMALPSCLERIEGAKDPSAN